VDSAGTAYLASDDRVFGLAAPAGTRSKIVATAGINGWVYSLMSDANGIGVLGTSYPGSLTPTKYGPWTVNGRRFCTPGPRQRWYGNPSRPGGSYFPQGRLGSFRAVALLRDPVKWIR
jgi:hypothetical protein